MFRIEDRAAQPEDAKVCGSH